MQRIYIFLVISLFLCKYQFISSSKRLLTTTSTSCGYKCSTCDSASPSICLSCNPTSNRSLSGQDCPCNIKYFDAGQPSCFACPANCLSCTSSTQCTQCDTGFYNYNGNCVTACPVQTYVISASFLCRDYLSFTVSQERDSKNRIIVNFDFNYPLNPVTSSVNQITLQILEDSTGSNVSILHVSSSDPRQLSYLIVPRTSLAEVTLITTAFDIVNLVSLNELVPLSSSTGSSIYAIAIPPYLVPFDQTTLSIIKSASNFLFQENTVGYVVLEILRDIAIFVHIFPCLQFILGLTLMQVFKTPIFHYSLKLLAGFGQSRVPDWEMIDTISNPYGLDYQFLFYYALQLSIFAVLFGISKIIYQRNKQSYKINQHYFAKVIKIHCFLVDAFQHTTEILLFYLIYYSVFIIKELNFSSPINIAYFVLAILILLFIFFFHSLGTYRIYKDCYHLFYVFVKDLNEKKNYARYYFIIITPLKKVIFTILICACYSVNSLVVMIPIIIVYVLELIFFIVIRPFTNPLNLIIKIIEISSQFFLFAAILTGQIYYNIEKSSIILNSLVYKIIDIICLSFFGIYLLVSLVKMILGLRDLLKPTAFVISKRSLTFLQFQNRSLPNQPSGKGTNQVLIDKTGNIASNMGSTSIQSSLELQTNIDYSKKKDQNKFQKQLPIIIAENNVLKRFQAGKAEEKDIVNKQNNPFNIPKKNIFQGLSNPIDGKAHMWNRYSNQKEMHPTIGMLIEQKKVKENSDVIISYLSNNQHGIEMSNKLNNNNNNNNNNNGDQSSRTNNNEDQSSRTNNNGDQSSRTNNNGDQSSRTNNNGDQSSRSNNNGAYQSIEKAQLQSNDQSLKINGFFTPQLSLNPQQSPTSSKTIPFFDNSFTIKPLQNGSNTKKLKGLDDIVEEDVDQQGGQYSSQVNLDGNNQQGSKGGELPLRSIKKGQNNNLISSKGEINGNNQLNNGKGDSQGDDDNQNQSELENSRDKIMRSGINLNDKKYQDYKDEDDYEDEYED